MTKYPRQIVIKKPLWDFMEYCQVYCSAACCGTEAFEIHPALLLRRVYDENLSGKDGHKLFWDAWQQLRDLMHYVDNHNLTIIEGGGLPIWSEEITDLPQYWFAGDEFSRWLKIWDETFIKASRYSGLETKVPKR